MRLISNKFFFHSGVSTADNNENLNDIVLPDGDSDPNNATSHLSPAGLSNRYSCLAQFISIKISSFFYCF